MLGGGDVLTTAEVLLAVVLVLGLFLWLGWLRANRLDRLHRKVASTRATLDSQLVRRAAVAAELASSGRLDPVSSVLIGEGAFEALDIADWEGPARQREEVESALSSTLRAVLDDEGQVEALRCDPVGARLLEELAQAWYRVQLARRFHNEAVSQAQRVRRKALVRLFRLAGHAEMPQTIEIDDAWPDAMPRPGSVT